jgi:hypothetical protein
VGWPQSPGRTTLDRSRLALPLALLLAACGGSSSSGRLQAYPAVDGAGPVDLLVDGAFRVGSISEPGRSGYQEVGSGNHRVQLVLASRTVLVDLVVSLPDGASVSVLASGGSSGTPPVVGTALTDDDSTPAAGQARLRVVHADSALADVILSGTLRAEGTTDPAAPPVTVAFQSGTYLATVTAGRYRLLLANATSGALVGDFPTGPIAAGSVVTALVSDPVAGSQVPATVGYHVDAP